MQYSINLTFHFVEELVLYLFHVFTGRKNSSEQLSNQTVHV